MSKAPLIRLASMIFNEPLAIRPDKLDVILNAIGPRLVLDEASLDELAHLHAIPSRTELTQDVTVIRAQMPDEDGADPKPYRLTPEGIAVIPVRGTLMKRFSFLSAVSGCSTYASLGQAATTALADPLVKGVLFDIDSPGGTTHGCFELCDAIYQMRGEKPMWSVANDMAASAAYALASATDRIYLTRTAGVGSVGVFALHADQSGADEQAGLKYTYVFAGKKKVDGNPHETLGKSARADVQAEVDREYQMFVAAVARNRGFAGADAEKIAATEAAMFYAESAKPLLADEVATFEEALAALTSKVNGSKLISSGKLALAAESGNNTRDERGADAAPPTDPAGERKQGEATMTKLELKQRATTLAAAAAEAAEAAKAAAIAAADPKDDDDDDEDDDKKKPDPADEDAKKGKKGKKAAKPDDECDEEMSKRGDVTEIPLAANEAAKRIANLCQIAGAPELAADYIVRGYNVDKVIEKLSARRAKASAEGSVASFVTGDAGAGSGARASVDQAIEQARVMSINSGGSLSQSRCMERLMRANPAIYSAYMEERGEVAARVAFNGGGRALNEYVLNNQRRYMANLGLSTVIDDVPARRAM
jgi:signal peptide peptidase SppA